MDNFGATFKQYGVVFAIGALILYFLMAALQGQSGLFRYLQLTAQIEIAQGELDKLVEERKKMANLTHRLSDDFLDLDLLDEQARKRLGLMRPDEIIIE